MKSKFKVSDRVRVVSNKITPSSVGKTGVIIKVASGRDAKTLDAEWLYKVQLDNHKNPLKGYADDNNLELC